MSGLLSKKVLKTASKTICIMAAVACAPITLASASLATTAQASIAQTDLIKAGEYLATAGNCAGCHTSKDGDLYAGGVSFTTDFGEFYSTNITSDPTYGIGKWTETDFKNALRHGIRADGEHLYPVFPYTAYSALTDSDIAALYTYFKTVPASQTPSKEHDLSFPFNQRPLMAVWKALFFEPQTFANNPQQTAEWNRGAYLVESLGHCSACHTPRNLFGAEKEELAYSGESYLDYLPNGRKNNWYAVNLTQSSDGLADWSKKDIEEYLSIGLNRFATSFGPMNKVISHSTSQLTPTDVAAMATYLKSLPGSEESIPVELAKSDVRAGASLYSIHCATCHLPTGKGDIETGPALLGNPIVEGKDPSSLINAILYAPELPRKTLPVQRTKMDDYEHKLSNEEVALISSYIRQAWGNAAKPVSPEQVEQQR